MRRPALENALILLALVATPACAAAGDPDVETGGSAALSDAPAEGAAKPTLSAVADEIYSAYAADAPRLANIGSVGGCSMPGWLAQDSKSYLWQPPMSSASPAFWSDLASLGFDRTLLVDIATSPTVSGGRDIVFLAVKSNDLCSGTKAVLTCKGAPADGAPSRTQCGLASR
jgi:hypothetical protein